MLNEQELFESCPAAFSKKPHGKKTAMYKHISTIDVVRELAQHDFFPYSARQDALKRKDQFAKHVIRFRNEKMARQKGRKGIPEALLYNAHNGISQFILRFGIYVFVCSNGLVVADGPETCVRIKHVGDVLPKVVEGTKFVLDHATKVVKTMDDWSKVQLRKDERLVFAEAARLIRFGKATPISAEQLLAPRHKDQSSEDLWITFNVIQENVIRGGISAVNSNQRRITSHNINNLTRDLRLNQALWSLGQEVYDLKERGKHVTSLHA